VDQTLDASYFGPPGAGTPLADTFGGAALTPAARPVCSGHHDHDLPAAALLAKQVCGRCVAGLQLPLLPLLSVVASGLSGCC
jgi:hypothetical protein